MRHLNIATTRLATLLMLHAAGVGLASPTVLVTRPLERPLEFLPRDNQTVYRLSHGESKRLELNTSYLSEGPVFITVSPCTRDVRWAVYHGKAGNPDNYLSVIKEFNSAEDNTFSTIVSRGERYIVQLSSTSGGAAAVSVRGEKAQPVRLRLRARSKRRLVAYWDPSPIDPQATFYCVIASHRRNYTSLCAAQYDIKINRRNNRLNADAHRLNHDNNRLTSNNRQNINSTSDEQSIDVSNQIDVDPNPVEPYHMDMGNFRSGSRRKKFSRSTKVTDEDPMIACVGDRTHHLIENMDPSIAYFVSVFGVAADRRAGTLLASGRVRPRTATARRLRENVASKAELRGRLVFYFKATVGPGGGLWLAVSSCGGGVDVEVTVRGKRVFVIKNIDPHQNFFVPAPMFPSSIQETSDEGSIQFDSSSSEEARMRYVIKVLPSHQENRESGISVELTASTNRWGINTPELPSGDGAIVREIRPRRSCRSVDVAFLPASHHATDVIRYCITARENTIGESFSECQASKRSSAVQCFSHSQETSTKAIVQKVNGLKPGRKYAIQVTASFKGNSVPYKTLYADTTFSCNGE